MELFVQKQMRQKSNAAMTLYEDTQEHPIRLVMSMLNAGGMPMLNLCFEMYRLAYIGTCEMSIF